MCKHWRLLSNIYTGKDFLCACRKCPSCLQKRADAYGGLIRQHIKQMPDYMQPYFVTLTYRRFDVPYIKFTDYMSLRKAFDVTGSRYQRLNVYRSTDYRRVRSSCGCFKYMNYLRPTLLEVRDVTYALEFNKFHFCEKLAGKKIGVIYYRDLQNYIKLLKFNLLKKYHYDTSKDFSYFATSELGPTTHRPHFHLIIFVDRRRATEQQFRAAFADSWRYGDRRRTYQYSQPARDCSRYVSEYVNCIDFIPPFLQRNFRPKKSCSKGFGWSFAEDLPAILEAASSGDFGTVVRQDDGTLRQGSISWQSIARYFPRYRGFSRLSPDARFSAVLHPWEFFRQYRKRLCYTIDNFMTGVVCPLECAYRRCCKYISSLSKDYYAWLHDHVWYQYEQWRLRSFYEDVGRRYINSHLSLYGLTLYDDIYQNSAAYVNKDLYYSEKFKRRSKMRSINELCQT